MKRYIFSLVLSLTLLGVIQHFQTPEANQEIVLQFSSSSSEDVEQSLSSISQTLEQLDAETIAVSSDKDGFYRITYHSDSEIKENKKFISNQVEVTYGNSKTSDKGYDFDVFKLEKGTTKTWDFDGHRVQTLNLKSDRSFTPDVLSFSTVAKDKRVLLDVNPILSENRYIVFTSDNTSHNIPEVRAGPLS